ncbi:hypothetical protein ACFO5K_19440 [Nocardia halotolerans]|uniref:Secreted protein n=1 Tax=Nocardia halotolerans TaxID=1755878 RepID=A0ABV8VJM3_9NOCA
MVVFVVVRWTVDVDEDWDVDVFVVVRATALVDERVVVTAVSGSSSSAGGSGDLIGFAGGFASGSNCGACCSDSGLFAIAGVGAVADNAAPSTPAAIIAPMMARGIMEVLSMWRALPIDSA